MENKIFSLKETNSARDSRQKQGARCAQWKQELSAELNPKQLQFSREGSLEGTSARALWDTIPDFFHQRAGDAGQRAAHVAALGQDVPRGSCFHPGIAAAIESHSITLFPGA